MAIEMEIHRPPTGKAEVRVLYPPISDTKNTARLMSEFAGTVPSLLIAANQFLGQGRYEIAQVLGDVEAEHMPTEPTQMFTELVNIMEKMLADFSVDSAVAIQSLESLITKLKPSVE